MPAGCNSVGIELANCDRRWRLVVIALRKLARNAARGVSAQLRVPRHNSQVQLGLDGVELKLETLKFGADAGCDLLAKVGYAQCAAEEYAQENTQEKD
jgi:hypothetical protein